jgi:hypoxanthine-DNA glycosylase
MFFYGHPQNRFWRVTASVLGAETPKTVAEKRELLLSHGIALWDVLASCEIEGSADSTIKNAVPNDISWLLKETKIEKIFVNGKAAEKYYDKYMKKALGREAVCLPSTSPANAAWSTEKLIQAWKIIEV